MEGREKRRRWWVNGKFELGGGCVIIHSCRQGEEEDCAPSDKSTSEGKGGRKKRLEKGKIKKREKVSLEFFLFGRGKFCLPQQRQTHARPLSIHTTLRIELSPRSRDICCVCSLDLFGVVRRQGLAAQSSDKGTEFGRDFLSCVKNT